MAQEGTRRGSSSVSCDAGLKPVQPASGRPACAQGASYLEGNPAVNLGNHKHTHTNAHTHGKAPNRVQPSPGANAPCAWHHVRAVWAGPAHLQRATATGCGHLQRAMPTGSWVWAGLRPLPSRCFALVNASHALVNASHALVAHKPCPELGFNGPCPLCTRATLCTLALCNTLHTPVQHSHTRPVQHSAHTAPCARVQHSAHSPVKP